MAKKNSTAKSDVLNEVETQHVNGAPVVADATKTTTSHRTTKVSIGGVEVEVPLGRPSNPDSERQKKLNQQEARRIANGGVARLGRPAVPGSPNQQKKMEMEAKKSNPDYVPRRGRPVVEGSTRQQDLLQKDLRLKQRALEVAIQQGVFPEGTTLEDVEKMEQEKEEHATA